MSNVLMFWDFYLKIKGLYSKMSIFNVIMVWSGVLILIYSFFVFGYGEENLVSLIQDTLLFTIVNLPLFGFLLLAFNNHSDNFKAVKYTYKVGIFISIFNCMLSFLLWRYFDYLILGFQFVDKLLQIPVFNYEVLIGVDGFSLYFIILTNIIIFLCIVSLTPSTIQLRSLISLLFLLQWGVLCSFAVLDLVGFFVFFETTLIPIFFIIIIWGSRARKVRAGYLISLYTLAGSIFMLFTIIFLISKVGSANYLILSDYLFSEDEQKIFWLAFFISFAVKLPLIPIHIWLPEAHVEAPTIGSVILAALLLKLGGYGFIRYNLVLFPLATTYYTPFVYIIALLSVMYTGLTSIRQTDLKKIIAYSSVGHMAVIMVAIVNGTSECIIAGIFQMISHGFVSAGLFFCVGVLYDRFATRYLFYYGGLVDIMPGFSTVFFLLSLANMSFPLTSNFIGEFGLFSSTFNNSAITAIVGCIASFSTVASTLWTYNRTCFGTSKLKFGHTFLDINFREQFILFGLIFWVIILGICPIIVSNGIYLTSLDVYLRCYNIF